MGLNHPDSLADWRRWARPSTLRRAVAAVRGRGRPADRALRLLLYGTAPTVLAALDSATLSGIAAGLRPVALGPRVNVAVLCPPHLVPAVQAVVGDPVEDRSITSADDLSALDGTVGTVLSLGHYLRAGELALEWAAARGVEYVVVQHGLLTPFAPPLPDEVTLYAFSHEDGAFWTGGRPGRTVRVVGSQMLWEAADPYLPAAQPGPTVFLGQLHGRELGRWPATQQTLAFLRAEPHVLYRPHPSERDMLSRATHRLMHRGGTRFETSGRPLPEVGPDVVALFSTGVLEAAAQGRGGWVYHTAPPAWLREFWQRYGMTPWTPGRSASDQPERTPAPVRPVIEPARAIARGIFGEESA